MGHRPPSQNPALGLVEVWIAGEAFRGARRSCETYPLARAPRAAVALGGGGDCKLPQNLSIGLNVVPANAAIAVCVALFTWIFGGNRVGRARRGAQIGFPRFLDDEAE